MNPKEFSRSNFSENRLKSEIFIITYFHIQYFNSTLLLNLNYPFAMFYLGNFLPTIGILDVCESLAQNMVVKVNITMLSFSIDCV